MITEHPLLRPVGGAAPPRDARRRAVRAVRAVRAERAAAVPAAPGAP